ncbi:NUDIX domain-containing protein [Candidatus Peregrinibacteria bacterium]|nr:NUDIX domain-containing protein [Candidatus Peregrinibacteria bacterium]
MMHEKSCGLVVYHKNLHGEIVFLLLHYPEGHWEFPKGHVESDENEKQTALREVQEETGIQKVHFVDGFKETIEYRFTRKATVINKVVTFFLARVDAMNISLSHEHKAYKWLPFDEAIKTVTFENARNILKKAKQFLA